MTLAVGLALLAGTAAAQAPEEGLPPAVRESLEAAVAAEVAQRGIPGLSAAVALDGRVRWTGAWGVGDLEHEVPARPDTVYRIASLAKPITATAVLQLADKGKLDLDSPIQAYVPAFPEKPWPLTARLLLAHQGGVRHVADEEWGLTRHYAGVVDALAVFKDDPLVHEPGTGALYSTYGYCLLGCAVESVAGVRFADYLQENVFAPAGMERAGLDDVFAIIPGRAAGYVRRASGELRNAILTDTSYKVPGGGLVATAPDVGRFAAALQSGTLLGTEALERMFAPQRTRDGKLTEYALGWRISRFKGRRELWHNGGQPQVSTLLYMQPDRALAVVFLCNLEGVAPELFDLARRASLLVAP